MLTFDALFSDDASVLASVAGVPAGGLMARRTAASEPADRGGCGSDRTLIARIAAAERWGRTADRVAATEPARRGLRARFEREADPDGILDVAERIRRADALFAAHMLRLARASVRARRGRP